MADIPEVIATYDALVGVALGAGLTYGFSVLNRRHQEVRENATRWYNARREAYYELFAAAYERWRLGKRAHSEEERSQYSERLGKAYGSVQMVCSPEVNKVARALVMAIFEDDKTVEDLSNDFIIAARKRPWAPRPRPPEPLSLYS